MSLTSKQSPLGINVLGSLLQNQGLGINAGATNYMGISTRLSNYTFGTICNIPALSYITYAIRGAYEGNTNTEYQTVSDEVYSNLINIGVSSGMGAFGNSKPPTLTNTTPPGQFGMGMSRAPRGWGGSEWTAGNEATSWGFLRLLPFQAYNEFNYNNGLEAYSANIPGTPGYLDFLSSFNTASGFTGSSNQTIISVNKSKTFLKGTYSNMNDLITGEISGISLATIEFGNDLINLGKVINLAKIKSFGTPSVLLSTLNTNNALTESVILAILSNGIEPNELNAIINGLKVATIEQQRKLYGAFCVIVGSDLKDVLTPLNCATQGLESLADLLNVKKLFPTSYQTLTVPVYNRASTQTNSKTYYLIYENGAVSSRLSSPDVINQFITYYPDDINYTTVSNSLDLVNDQSGKSAVLTTNLNFQEPPKGFGSFLYGIIPNDMAIAAGAFSTAVSQIKNITNVQFEKFAQVVRNLETIKDLNINGTDVPVNTELQQQAADVLSKGIGPSGSYTMSDFFGSMSGLSYNGPFKILQDNIPNLITPALLEIYRQIYLTAGWGIATGKCTYQAYSELIPSADPPYIYSCTITGVEIISGGGGYTTYAPSFIITVGSEQWTSGTSVVGTDSNNIPTYAKVYKTILSNPGSAIVYGSGYSPTPDPVPENTANVVFLPPPGTWPALNFNLQELINQANQELLNIKNINPDLTDKVNAAWLDIGTQLNKELVARSTCFQPPITEPQVGEDITPIGSYPLAQTTFVDSIADWAAQTLPHMQAQTLEAIANLQTTGGQSLVGLMRETRNQARLTEIGIPLDNTIPDTLTDNEYAQLIANGSIPPAVLITDLGSPEALGSYNPNTGDYNVGNPGVPVPIGKPSLSGSLAGSEFTNLIPPQLNTLYSSNTLLSSTYSIQQAIDEVVRCNCDCWVLA